MPHLARLEALGVVRVAGPDARPFLQGQLTADLRRVSASLGTLAAWCNPQGRALFLGFLILQGEDFLWILPASDIERCVKRLRLYVLRAKVTVEDLRGQWEVAGDLERGAPDTPAFAGDAPGEGLCRVCLPAGAGLALVAGPTRELTSWLATNGGAQGSEADWNLAALQAGLPWVEGPTAERFIPQQLNLDQFGVMSFDKGCYAGQEVIARLKYRGQVRQRLRVGHATTALEPGQRLYRANAQASQSAGELLQVAPRDGLWHCTAVIDVDCEEPLFAGAPGGPRVDFAPPLRG